MNFAYMLYSVCRFLVSNKNVSDMLLDLMAPNYAKESTDVQLADKLCHCLVCDRSHCGGHRHVCLSEFSALTYAFYNICS